jgi:endoglucanase
MMLQAWEQFGATLEQVPLMLPEQGGTYPDFLDELKWEADWLRKMQYGPTDGRVYHQLKTLEFPSFVLPAADTKPRYFTPYSSTATADYVAALAKASRAIAPYDATSAADWLAAAELSYAWLTNNPDYHPVSPGAPPAGSLGYDSTDPDDRLWAAAEMWETTGDAAALADFETRAKVYGTQKVDYDWDWGNLKNLGMFTYALSRRAGREPALLADINAQIVERANQVVGTASRHGYGRFLGDYWWGVNGSVARACMLLETAHAISPSETYLDACVDQVAFLYGRNPYDRSFVTEEGVDPPRYPHHRPSGADGIGAPYPGLLVGGGWPTATSWRDLQGDYEQNEVAINWNGALVYALAGFLKPGAWDGTGGAPTHLGRIDTSLDVSGPPEMIDDLEDGDLEILEVAGRNGMWGTNADGTAAAPPVIESVTPGPVRPVTPSTTSADPPPAGAGPSAWS